MVYFRLPFTTGSTGGVSRLHECLAAGESQRIRQGLGRLSWVEQPVWKLGSLDRISLLFNWMWVKILVLIT